MMYVLLFCIQELCQDAKQEPFPALDGCQKFITTYLSGDKRYVCANDAYTVFQCDQFDRCTNQRIALFLSLKECDAWQNNHLHSAGALIQYKCQEVTP
jgi:hypothetical protein